MSPTTRNVIIWAPRILGIAVTLFLAVFALDAFDGRSLAETLPAFAIHLVPAGVVGVVVAIAWRVPWFGTVALVALAAAYAATVPAGRLDWVAVISGPLLVVALLFALSAVVTTRRAHA
jgi:hypothetical protein